MGCPSVEQRMERSTSERLVVRASSLGREGRLTDAAVLPTGQATPSYTHSMDRYRVKKKTAHSAVLQRGHYIVIVNEPLMFV